MFLRALHMYKTAYRCAQGYQALLAATRGDLALADSLAGAESREEAVIRGREGGLI